MLVAKGQPAQLKIEARDYDGILTDVDDDVTVTVKDIDGATVESGTAATVPGNLPETTETGVYVYNLGSTVTGNLGVYEATATFQLGGSEYTRTYQVETVGEYLFEIHELRARDSKITETSYPAEQIRRARESATQTMENAALVAFAPRAKRAILSGDGTTTLLLPDTDVTEILGCTIYSEDTGADTGDAITGAELVDIEANRNTGLIVRTDGRVFPAGSNNVLVDYVHGYDRVPGPVREAAMTLAIEYLVPSAIPARATAQSTEIADYRISVANPELGRDTGIPAVDAVIAEWGRKRPGLG